MDVVGGGGEMQGEEERGWEMAAMDVDAMLGEPGVAHAEGIGEMDKLGGFAVHLPCRSIGRAFDVIQ
jgi:hypothetical protein